MSLLEADLILSYPRTAEVGRRYPFTIDIAHAPGAWKAEKEEYAIHCQIEAGPGFACEALGDAAIVVHRFGGSYAPAEFILRAVEEATTAPIRISLLSSQGSVLQTCKLTDIRISAARPRTVSPPIEPTLQADLPFAWLNVCGTRSYELSAEEREAGETLGRTLAESGWGLVTCAYTGLDHVVTRAFVEGLRGDTAEVLGQRVLRIVRKGREPDFEWGRLVEVEPDEDELWRSAEQADAVLVLGASESARESALAAGRAGRLAFAQNSSSALPEAIAETLASGFTREALSTIAQRLAALARENRWVVPAELRSLATKYLRPQPLGRSDSIAQTLRDTLVDSPKKLEVPADIVLHRLPAPTRVVCYVHAQISSERRLLVPILDALPAEVRFAGDFFETRPLFQALVALRALLDDPSTQSVAREAGAARILASCIGELERRPDLDSGGECRRILRQLAHGFEDEPDALMDFAAKYEAIRATSAGPTRTAEMNAHFDRIRAFARANRVTSERVLELYASGREGQRIVAVGCAATRDSNPPVGVLADVVRNPRTPFEQWAALLVIRSVADAAPFQLADQPIAAVIDALEDPTNVIHQENDTSRSSLATGLLDGFARRVGFRRGDSAHLARWLSLRPSAGRTNPARRVAVMGSSPSQEVGLLCRAVGVTLAEHGWTLTCAPGEQVGAELSAGFLKRGGDARVLSPSQFEVSIGSFYPQLVDGADVCLVVDGERGTATEVEFAKERRIPLVALASTGGVARKMAEEARAQLVAAGAPDAFVELVDVPGNVEERAERIVRVLNLVAELRSKRDESSARWLGKLGPFPWDLWPNGATIQVRFLDGSRRVQSRVERIAREWCSHANVRFDFGRDPRAPIRVTFGSVGSWALSRSAALATPLDEPTLALMDVTGQSERDLRRQVLHEFGEALGLVNETSSPNARIEWDFERAYRELSQPPNSWTREQIERNLFSTYAARPLQTSAGDVDYRAFDPASVMMNPIGDLASTSWSSDADQASELSLSDRAFIARLYPPDVTTTTLEPARQLDGVLGAREVHKLPLAFDAREEGWSVTVRTRSAGLVIELVGEEGVAHWRRSFDSDATTSEVLGVAMRPGSALRVIATDPSARSEYAITLERKPTTVSAAGTEADASSVDAGRRRQRKK